MFMLLKDFIVISLSSPGETTTSPNTPVKPPNPEQNLVASYLPNGTTVQRRLSELHLTEHVD